MTKDRLQDLIDHIKQSIKDAERRLEELRNHLHLLHQLQEEERNEKDQETYSR